MPVTVGGFRDRDDDDDRVGFRSQDDGPSRADTADSWGGEKKFQPSGDSSFGSRYTSNKCKLENVCA